MTIKTTALRLALCSLMLPTAAALAQTDVSKFPLSKAIPDDVFIAVSARANPEREFLNKYWSEVFDALMESGVLTDLWDSIAETVPDEELEAVESTMDRFSELFHKIEWSALFDKEFIHCGRYNTGTQLLYEGLFIGRADKATADANYTGLKRLLAELVKFGNEKHGQSTFKLEETKVGKADVTRLSVPSAMDGLLCIAHQDDVLFISIVNDAILKDALNLYNGEGEKKGLVTTARFKGAFDALPPAEDCLVFFDVENMMGTFRTMMAMFASPPAAEPAEGEAAAQKNPMQAISQLLHDVSIIDYIASTEWTDGHRIYTDSFTALRPNAKSSPLYEVATSGRPMENFERFIPKEADAFSVSAGINLSKLYRYILNFVEKNAPDGKASIAEWEAMQANQLKLDVDKDVLSLFEGTMISFSDGDNSVLMLRTTNSEKMEAQLARLIGLVKEMGGQSGLSVNTVQVDKATFTQFMHPMLMMAQVSPVVGVAKDHVILATSINAVRLALRTAAGEHDNITKNDRWKAEALRPKGAVVSIAFTDESNLAGELQEAIGGISMAIGMMGMFTGELPPEGKKFVSAVPPMLAKLGPVAGHLDFYKSSATYSTFDGRGWTSHAVQNYKTQEERPVREPAPGGAADGEADSEDVDADSHGGDVGGSDADGNDGTP